MTTVKLFFLRIRYEMEHEALMQEIVKSLLRFGVREIDIAEVDDDSDTDFAAVKFSSGKVMFVRWVFTFVVVKTGVRIQLFAEVSGHGGFMQDRPSAVFMIADTFRVK